MGSLTRSINFELPRDLHFDKYAQQVLENSSKTVAADTSSMHASTPTITTFDDLSSSDFLQKIGASILSSIQLKHKLDTQTTDFQHQSSLNAVNTNMDLDFTPNRVVIDSSSFNAMDELQKQLEYDKFMNEVWIGIVFTLILISMIFCICSCFLYHQFRTWKRNYHNTATQCASANDVEALKLQPDLEDPVPEYTLVSGLPSYEAALELLHKTPQSCLIVYPSVFSVFNKHERGNVDGLPTAAASAAITGTPTATANTAQQQHHLCDVTMPLLAATTTPTTAAAAAAAAATIETSTPTREVIKPNFVPIPSYSEAMSYKTIDEKSLASASAILTPTQTQTTTGILARNNNKSENSLLTLTHKNQSDKC